MLALASGCGGRSPLPFDSFEIGDAGAWGGAGARNSTTAGALATDQIDLLLMIDNSGSMADKQDVLVASVPELVRRLIDPRCVDASGNLESSGADANSGCPGGYQLEFAPVKDLHVGVVSSSLGGHGGDVCADTASNDWGQLLGALRPEPSYTTWNQSGFLAWDPAQADTPAGEKDPESLISNFKNMVASAGQSGCGYESQLEAWYRFLIDPDPPTKVSVENDLTLATFPERSQNPVLAQRAEFLRPGSLVVILMLSDENDCSIEDAGQSWVVGVEPQRLPRATSACANDPNDVCCFSCSQTASVPAGCNAPASDAACALGDYSTHEDNQNLRCYDQKRRFGFEFLQPLERYVQGLTAQSVPSRRAPGLEPNPLFSGGQRSPKMVFLAGIVGVPWQDLADPSAFDDAAPLKYLDYQELVTQGRWSLVLSSAGDSTTVSNPPGDKLMFETPSDRTTLFGAALHPLLGARAALAAAGSFGLPNAINGHESSIGDESDLQYACIFPLPSPRTCDSGIASCDCDPQSAIYQRAICDGTTQRYAKAYPGVRELQVLNQFGAVTGNAVTGSICPKFVRDPSNDASAGYNPFMSLLIEALKPALPKP